MRSDWSRVVPLSKRIVVLVKKGNLEIDTYKENAL
jgi:hypothetical protein